MKRILLGCLFIVHSHVANAELIQLDFSFDNVIWSESIYVPEENFTYGGMNQENIASSGSISAVFDTQRPIFRQNSSEQDDGVVRIKQKGVMYDAGGLSVSIESDWKDYFLSHQLDTYDYQYRNHSLGSSQQLYEYIEPKYSDFLSKYIHFSDGFNHTSFDGYIGDVSSGNYTEIYSHFRTSTSIRFHEFVKGDSEQPQFLTMQNLIDAFKTETIRFNSNFSTFTTLTTYSDGSYQSQVLQNFKEEQYNGQLKLVTVNEPKLHPLLFLLILIFKWRKQFPF